jgi:Icc-related predicted phosphoesterase
VSSELSLFHVADLHGADRCFRKWLNAGPFYGAEVVVIGGDLTGKVLVPVYPSNGGGAERWTATWNDRDVVLETEAEVAEFARTVRTVGAYAFTTTVDEVAEIRASAEREREVFTRLKLAALEEWISWADERLAKNGVRGYVMPGNDDPPEIDGLLDTAVHLKNVQGRAVEIAPGIWMASRGESTPTPWHTPREVPDEELGRLVNDVTRQIPAGVVSIWNMHMPPHATDVDVAPVLGEDLRLRYDAGGDVLVHPVGSTTLRAFIEAHQPDLAMHGHIHEGRGRYRIGRTVGVNPGSLYQEGVLQGVLVRISSTRGVRDVTFTTG